MVILKLCYWMKSIFVFINLVLHIQRKRLEIEETEARRRVIVSDLLESRRLSFHDVDGFCFTTSTATALCVHGGDVLIKTCCVKMVLLDLVEFAFRWSLRRFSDRVVVCSLLILLGSGLASPRFSPAGWGSLASSEGNASVLLYLFLWFRWQKLKDNGSHGQGGRRRLEEKEEDEAEYGTLQYMHYLLTGLR
ncbi:hypothetical protein F2Q69_00005074 [Brassica cretica]|uniref:Uncharacterized protein n=1 Tax=Brassica cretica TaxID=69181 RepID=A0A8S9NU29_BRACR|nr:hypothetical protein F2Q69_00005074 [Brassica cretica]